jgi:hypothetical protein
MQAEYCATVAVQVEGMSLQPLLLAQGSPPCVQLFSWVVQFCCSTACEGALLDAA